MSLDRDSAPQFTRSAGLVPLGFSLVEVMIAMVIGLILVAVVGQSFLTGRATYQTEEGLSRIQENARFAIDFMSRDIRMAGYLGCQGRNAFANGLVTNLLKPGNVDISTSPLIGYEYKTGSTGSALSDWSPPLPDRYFAAGDVLPGTDVLVIQRAADTGIPLTATMVTESANLFVTPNTELNDGDIIFVSDCERADLIQITTTNVNSGELTHNTGVGVATPGNAANGGPGQSQKLSKMYAAGTSHVYKLFTQIYYIANRSGTTTPALYRKTLQIVPTVGPPPVPTATYAAEELVENVESMHIEYAHDLNDATQPISRQILNAASIPAPPSAVGWPRVTSVRVGLLLRSDDNADQTPDTRSYTVAHKTIAAANDLRRRRAFNFTVQLRN